MTFTGSNLGSVSTLRIAVSVVALALVCSACTPSSSGDLDIQTGCTSVTAKRELVASGVAMTVRAAGCADAATAVDRIAAAVWRSLRQPVDEIRIEVPARDGDGARMTVALSRGVLTDRFGDGPSGPVVASVERDDISLWLLLPFAWITAGLGVLALTCRAARTGAVLFVIK